MKTPGEPCFNIGTAGAQSRKQEPAGRAPEVSGHGHSSVWGWGSLPPLCSPASHLPSPYRSALISVLPSHPLSLFLFQIIFHYVGGT